MSTMQPTEQLIRKGWRYSPLEQAYIGPDGSRVHDFDEDAVRALLASEPEEPKVADEIRNQNVVAVWRDGSEWRARIGPAGLGLEAKASHPARALRTLAAALEIKGWAFDPTYEPRPEPSFHDA